MRHRQIAVLNTLQHAQIFLDMNADALADVNASSRKQLDDVVANLLQYAIDQDGGARGAKGATARQRALLESLRVSYMAPIADVAKWKLQEVPAFIGLKLPPSNSSAADFVTAAMGMAESAAPHAQTFIDSGLPATFLDDLRTAATAVTESIDLRENHIRQRRGATAGISAEVRRGHTLLRVLNALIVTRIGTDEARLAQWTAAKMVRRKPGPTAGSQSSDPAPIRAVKESSTSAMTMTM